MTSARGNIGGMVGLKPTTSSTRRITVSTSARLREHVMCNGIRALSIELHPPCIRHSVTLLILNCNSTKGVSCLSLISLTLRP